MHKCIIHMNFCNHLKGVITSPPQIGRLATDTVLFQMQKYYLEKYMEVICSEYHIRIITDHIFEDRDLYMTGLAKHHLVYLHKRKTPITESYTIIICFHKSAQFTSCLKYKDLLKLENAFFSYVKISYGLNSLQCYSEIK